ncbi:methionine/alanine import NSS transporter subunit MetS [uncultured Corynebacterium sp.]|uniref:methionine/alanine import NSS transporter subunit MetS n=1 Tax=uncultured Corynebacterium sp. TaxID=159447 RepID=UPI0025F570DC|nr:methionine/alanine import NSS transporter subunit MetS [uncultured Corynebacterium sp.]
MSGIAIVMMALFIVIIWGGFIASVANLVRHPDESSGELAETPHTSNEVLSSLEEQ